MKIVIFAAGEGVRMRPLTLHTPKPLLLYRGKTNLDHLFSLLPSEIDEAILVVKHLAHKIKDYCGESFHGRRIHYVEGSERGNAIGFLATRPLIKKGERFAVAYGDEVFVGDEITQCLNHDYSWNCFPAADPTKVGVATLDKCGRILEVIEKPAEPKSNLAADGFMVVDSSIFKYQPTPHVNGEYYFSGLMNQFIKNHHVVAVVSLPHPQLTTVEDLKKLDQVDDLS